MNKIFYWIASLVITALIAVFAADAWRSHEHIRTQGREGTLRIGQRYNASRWAAPLPLKKIHAYTATMAPNYEVILESDQDFTPGQQVFIRFLERSSQPTPCDNLFLRPVSGRIRLRTEADGTPAKVDPTAPLDRALNLAMGSQSTPAPTGGTVAATPSQSATFFLVGGANDGTPELIWNNSRAGEWVLILLLLFLLQAFAINAWTLPWRPHKPADEDPSFVHPSLKKVEPDASPTPVTRIAFKPKPKEPPESAAKPEVASETDHVLKLPRK